MSFDEPILLRRLGTEPFEEITAPYNDERVEITRNGNNVVAFVKSFYVEIKMRWRNDHMNYDVNVPRELCQNSKGHIGNCDNNENNDRSSPDERKLHA